MRALSFLWLPLFFLHPVLVSGQNFTARILDLETRKPIPFASIIYDGARGVISNEEGFFSLNAEGHTVSVISISSLGYETMEFDPKEIEQEIFLKPKTIELGEVFLTNEKLSAREIFERAKNKVADNYIFTDTKKSFFLRQSNFNVVNNFDLKVEESTMPGIDQNLMNRIAKSIPRFQDSYKEVLGYLYGNYEQQNIRIIKAANLHNPKSTTSLSDLTEELEHHFRKNLKKNSYLKIRTGLIGVKVDAKDLEEELGSENKKEELSKEKTIEEKEEELVKSRERLQKKANSEIKNLLHTMFWKNDITFNLFEKSRKYKFELQGLSLIGGSTVYIINFGPKRGADYKGTIYIDALDYGVHRVDYKNVKPLKKFSLFGISTSSDVYRGKMYFSKDEHGKYQPQYIEQEQGESFGIDRPLTIIEKNKLVKGRRKQNELDFDIKISASEIYKTQLVIYHSSPIDQENLQEVEFPTDFEYQTFKRYNPDFWVGTNIIEPNAAIKKFTAGEPQ